MKKIIYLISALIIIIVLTTGLPAHGLTSLGQVKNVRIFAKENTYITLQWNKVNKAAKYQIKVLNSKKKVLRILATENLKKKIRNLTRNKVYYFKVRAKKGEIVGPWSDLKKARTTDVDEDEEEEVVVPAMDFSSLTYSGNETGEAVVITVNISSSASSDVTVNYATSDGTATAGSDYTASTGTLTIAAGNTSSTFSVTPLNDIANESDETVIITISNPINATLANANNPATLTIADNDSLTISSPSFTDNGTIPDTFSCFGSDVNPELNWISAPANTQSFVLLVRDIDVVGDFMHWIVKDISSSASGVAQNTVPTGGNQLDNDFLADIYNGPCPPSGETHHYQFEIYALSSATVDASTHDELESNMQGYILEQDYITGLYTSL